MEINGIDINDIELKITDESRCNFAYVNPLIDEDSDWDDKDYIKLGIDCINTEHDTWWIDPETVPSEFYEYEVRRVAEWEKILKEKGYENYETIAMVIVLETLYVDIMWYLYPNSDSYLFFTDYYDEAIVSLIAHCYDYDCGVNYELFVQNKCEEWKFYTDVWDNWDDVDDIAQPPEGMDEIFQQNIKNKDEKIKQNRISEWIKYMEKNHADRLNELKETNQLEEITEQIAKQAEELYIKKFKNFRCIPGDFSERLLYLQKRDCIINEQIFAEFILKYH